MSIVGDQVAPPSRDIAPQVDEYTRLKQMSADEIERMGLLGEIHFDFDRADIRDADRQILTKNADVLKKFDFLRITVEGHCDERGTREYNLALGERRANSVKNYLVALGVDGNRLQTISYGKERPAVEGHDESAFAQNRRGVTLLTQ